MFVKCYCAVGVINHFAEVFNSHRMWQFEDQ